MMKKFPVTSTNGNVYLVKMIESFMFESHYEVRVYEEYVGLFGRKKYRFLNEEIFGGSRSYDIRKFNYNLVEVAKHEIQRMENEWEAEKQLKNKKLEAQKEFIQWDGKC